MDRFLMMMTAGCLAFAAAATEFFKKSGIPRR